MDQALPMVMELNQKIDLLTTQVQFLTEQAQRAERERQERAELMHDVMPIVNDAFRLTTEQLEEVQEYVDLDDLLRLLQTAAAQRAQHRKDARPTRESDGSGADCRPADRQRVRESHRSAAEPRSTRATSASPGAACRSWTTSSLPSAKMMYERLGENVVLILNVVKDMTQPEIMSLVHNIVSGVEDEVAKPVNTSLPALLGQMRDPNVRRGLALTMRVLRVVGAQSEAGK